MLAAIQNAGHELLLIVRDFVAPLAADLFPEARILRCTGNPYAREFAMGPGLGQELLQELKKFAPELLVIAPYQYTQLEETLAAALPEVDCLGFNGYLFQARMEITAVSAIRFAVRVQVDREAPELEKNSLLCAEILGNAAKLPPPRIEASPGALAEAAVRLENLGLAGQPFWAVCAGDATYKSVRNWRLDRWAELCAGLVSRTGATLVFVGTPEEHASTLEIQQAMGETGLRTASITVDPLKLSTLTAILHLSEGYIGKDTGTMHIAAALGKPVLAVFGGGTWPRFIPAAVSGAVFTIKVPCTGCDWWCPLSRSHCVKDVPVAPVAAKAESMVRRKAKDFSVNVLDPDPILASAILKDIVESVRLEQRKVAGERANFMQWHDDRMNEIGGLKSQLSQAAADQESLAAEVKTAVAARMASEAGLLAKDEEIQTWKVGLQAKDEEIQTWKAGLQAKVLEIQSLETERFDLNTRLAVAAKSLELEKRLADSIKRQSAEDRIALASRLERIRQSTSRKLADARAKSLALRTANAQLEAATETATRQCAEWKSKSVAAEADLLSTREYLEVLTIRSATLQSQVDTVESRYQGLLADQEQLLNRKSAELKSALALIPDLREELAALRSDLGASEGLVRTLEAECGERLALIEVLTERLKESEADRQERLHLIEEISARLSEIDQDRHQRLLLIQRLSSELETVEADRKLRGEQIAKLHEHSAHLEKEMADLRNLLPYRVLKQLHIY